MATVVEDKPFSTYSGVVGYSWPKDPFAKGSYSSIGIGQSAEELFSLSNPINNTLFFIGEHTTADYTILGTMEGAVESGERVAITIRSLRSTPSSP